MERKKQNLAVSASSWPSVVETGETTPRPAVSSNVLSPGAEDHSLEDPRLEKLWHKAKTSGKVFSEELDQSWREFQHHREKVQENKVLLETLSRTEEIKENVVSPADVTHGQENVLQSRHAELKDRLRDISQDFDHLRKVGHRGCGAEAEFDEPQVMDLWDPARSSWKFLITNKHVVGDRERSRHGTERYAFLEEKTKELGYKVVDYNKIVQPRFDKALETLTRNTIAEATEAAIKAVKEQLLSELQAKKQVFTLESQRESSLEDNEEAKMKSDDKDDVIEYVIEEVTADHPEVLSIIKETVKMAKDMNFEQPHEKIAEILDEVLQEVAEENKNRFYGAPKYGGWILDNYPIMKELWMVLVDKGILPDLVICLSDTENNEAEETEAEADKEIEGEESELHEGSEAPAVAEETRGSLPEEPEVFEVPETEHEAEPFHYAGWELTMDDYDEETEDYQAEAEGDEELEEEEEEEENEDRIKEKRRHLGDTKHFCPVALKENFILQPGSTEEAAKYREKIYYFSSPEAKEKFLEQPEDYVAHDEPLKFEEFLQEKLMLKTEKKVGPEFEDDSEDEQFAKQELEELAIQANVTIEEENTKKLDDMISKRRAELIIEREQKRKGGETVRKDEDMSEEEPEDEEDDIDNILDEFPKDEEVMSEEDEEQEIDALKRLRGDALRYVLNHQPDTELALMLNWHLHKGMTAPDELVVQALELSLMGSTCNTAGVVIDGYPVSKYQVSLLEARSVIPMVIFELDVPSKEIFKRLLLEKKEEPSLPYPLHNSSQIIAVKNSKYRKNIDEIRQYYQEQHQNWYVIDGFHSKWWRFLENPELYVPPLAPHPLPSADMMPKRLTLSELKSRFPKCAELQGYCPVTYQDGKQRQVLALVQVQDDSCTRNKWSILTVLTF
ncbi:hypothetical protein J1605_022423 [Eschrichtius robustus]|uniref:Alpha-2-macroglobulin RAP C-terminal domain-containing protein n=1 Tax=Eschrichtius robustus TaxID=9764 RepID=A0AB34H9P4_ESCRO|nr:hypothetical protein J1605_022423 [Eschrichtius robustus]